ncbi:2-keto-4-pentenoate hydratase [Parvibaculum sp. MBR-TMA-1.3b-4.2]|jgi:2-keto-4-pentenoate hydratase
MDKGVSTGTDCEALAEVLATARKTRRPIAPISKTHPGFTVEEAYAVQEVTTERRLAAGERIVGHKIGLTSPAVQAQLGVSEPDFGMLFDVDRVPDGGALSMDTLIQPKVEAEIAFILKDDLADGPVTNERAAAAIDYAVAAIEIVDSAIEDWKITLPDTVADNASAAKFLIGTDRLPLDKVDLHLAGMELLHNGRQASLGVAAACLGNPLNAVVWLAKKMIEVGRPLGRGDIVLSGALGPMVTVAAGDEITVHVQGFKPLHLSFA